MRSRVRFSIHRSLRKASAKAHAYDHAPKQDGVARQHARGRASRVARNVHALVHVQAAHDVALAHPQPDWAPRRAPAPCQSPRPGCAKSSRASSSPRNARLCSTGTHTSIKRRDVSRAGASRAPSTAHAHRLSLPRVVELVLVQHLVLRVDDAPATLATRRSSDAALRDPRDALQLGLALSTAGSRSGSRSGSTSSGRKMECGFSTIMRRTAAHGISIPNMRYTTT